jgi:hypothetical protein
VALSVCTCICVVCCGAGWGARVRARVGRGGCGGKGGRERGRGRVSECFLPCPALSSRLGEKDKSRYGWKEHVDFEELSLFRFFYFKILWGVEH